MFLLFRGFLQTLFINKFHVKSVLKLSVKCAKLLDILQKVRFIVFRRVTCFGISPNDLWTFCCPFVNCQFVPGRFAPKTFRPVVRKPFNYAHTVT